MHTFTLTADVTPAKGSTPDDVLSVAVQAVNALTVVETSSARPVGAGVVSLKVKFLGLNENEARGTAQDAFMALQGRSGGMVSCADGFALRNRKGVSIL